MAQPRFTSWNTSDPGLDHLWRKVVINTVQDFGLRDLDHRITTIGPAWLRDHVHELKGYKYFGRDMFTGLEFFFRHQFEDGQFPDFFIPVGDQHVPFVTDPFKRTDEATQEVFMRIPVEADLEYLAVEGVYQAWKASGNLEWVKRQLPVLEAGLHYITTDKYRWNEEHQLIMRPHTVDTWDFTFFYDDDHFLTNCEIRRLDDSTPMCLFHGDNSGLYSAYRMLAEIHRALNSDTVAQDYEEQASLLKQRTNDLLWGDGFYTHMLHLDKETAERYPDERQRLSLSNSYDVNRGITDQQQSVSIVDTFRSRWLEKKDRYIAEWFTIDPPYNEKIAFFDPEQYVNGGLFGAVAGELAKAALQHGREEYGVDILRRYYDFVKDKNDIGFMWYPDGRGYGGGPIGWCGAAVVMAMMEGLAGIVDTASEFETVELSPRWVAAGIDQADITAHYPSSDAYFHTKYQKEDNTLRLEWTGTAKQVELKLLLPGDARPLQVLNNQKPLDYCIQTVEQSNYLQATTQGPSGSILVQFSE